MSKKIVITIANHKGGVGKTTTAVTLATGLASLGYPTVLVDCDGQHNISDFLGLESAPGLYDLVVTKATISEVGRRIAEKLVVIPSDADSTTDLETLFRTSSRLNPATALRTAFVPISGNGSGRPAIIIIDTAPSLSSIQVAALCAGDWLLIPASPEYASETGIAALVQAIMELQATGSSLRLLGILPTLVDPRSKEHRQTILDLHTAFPGLVLHPVRRRIAIAEAPRQGKAIWDYAPGAADDYARVLAGVMKRVGIGE